MAVTSKINSILRLILPQTVDPSIPPAIAGSLENISNAILQLQGYLEQYLGITQKQGSLWSSLLSSDTLLEHQLNRYYCLASETISAGSLVNLYDVGGGVINARNANATGNTKFAVGYCSTTGGVGAGSYAEFILLRGLTLNISGLTVGARYFLSTVNGLPTVTEPVAAGNIGQYVGFALAADRLLVDINMQWIQH